MISIYTIIKILFNILRLRTLYLNLYSKILQSHRPKTQFDIAMFQMKRIKDMNDIISIGIDYM
jgi:hypothetical protein